jgi:hypothetical protein
LRINFEICSIIIGSQPEKPGLEIKKSGITAYTPDFQKSSEDERGHA